MPSRLPSERIFDAEATAAALDFRRLVPALHAAFADPGRTTVPPRQALELTTAPGAGGTVLLMPAWDETHLGLKTIAVFPGNRALGLPALHASYRLIDARTGVPLASIDGDVLTARRTAAVAALGVSLLAPRGAARLLVIGAGRVARELAAAYASVRPIRVVRVWAPHVERAEALAADWRAAGHAAEAVGAEASALEAAVRDAEIVACATLATAPVVRGAWLAAGTHLGLIGSYTPAMREADVAAFAGAACVAVDTPDAWAKAGELLDAGAAGIFEAAAAGAAPPVRATLGELCRAGPVPTADGRRGRTVFKSVGTALADLVAAKQVIGAG